MPKYDLGIDGINQLYEVVNQGQEIDPQKLLGIAIASLTEIQKALDDLNTRVEGLEGKAQS